MTERSAAEQAEQMSLRRARVLPLLVLIYVTQQFSYFSQTQTERLVDHVRIGGWVVLSLVLLAALSTKGFWFHRQEVRDLIDDESTRSHRRDAMVWGFLASMLVAILLYVVAMFEAVSGREAIHIIVSFGLAAALVRFGVLERRAHRNG
jgi:hypothetical protein